jgi:hypothetical protein
MIVIKNSQLNTETLTVLNKLMEKEMNAKIAFRLMKIMKEISSLVDDKIKLEKKVLDRHSEKDSDGNLIPALDENGNQIQGAVQIKDTDAFNRDMHELLMLENEVGYDKIDFEELNLESIRVKELMQIEFLFK